MRQIHLAVLFVGPALLWACADSTPVAAPRPSGALPSMATSPGISRPMQLLDQCDPATFNAAVGPGTCLSGHPGVTFQTFIDQLSAHQTAPAWRNAPSRLTMSFGGEIVAMNRGGEVHTFTEVAKFGGGVVPILNQLSGTPIPAPECLAAPPGEFLPPGGQDAEAVTEHGTLLFQCCIHPWMRTTVVVK